MILDVVSGQGSQRDVADKWRIDRSTVVHVCKVAKQGALDALAASRPGRPGKTAAEVALEDALAEVARLRETITEQAIELHLVRGKDCWD
jgi:transposase